MSGFQYPDDIGVVIGMEPMENLPLPLRVLLVVECLHAKSSALGVFFQPDAFDIGNW